MNLLRPSKMMIEYCKMIMIIEIRIQSILIFSYSVCASKWQRAFFNKQDNKVYSSV